MTENKLIKSDIISYIWQHHDRFEHLIKAVDKTNIVVEDEGTFEDGIFKDCEIDVDGRMVEGNAKAFSTISEWNLYAQKSDVPKIDIILYEVADVKPRTTNYKTQFVEITVPAEVISNFVTVRSSNHKVCIEYLSNQNSMFISSILDKLLVERVNQKCNNIISIFNRCNNWDKVFNYLLFDTISISKVNRDNYTKLVEKIYNESISSQLTTQTEIEALLFGTAGFLSHINDECEYQKTLLKAYLPIEKQHSLKRMRLDEWELPMNNDVYINLAYLAALIFSKVSFMRSLYDEYEMKNIYKVMTKEVSPYWKRHHDFSNYEYPSDKYKALSKSKIDIFIINTIIPLNVAVNKQIGPSADDKSEKAINLMMKIKGEENKYTKKWSEYGMKFSTAYESQAIIQLDKIYCTPYRCSTCQLFSKMTK